MGLNKKVYREKRKGYRQGIYEVVNRDKYVGNSKPIYRSSWEKKYCRECDMSPYVLKWASESVKVPYIHPVESRKRGKKVVWNYYPDFIVQVKTASGVKTKMVEIKPHRETLRPRRSKNKSQKTLLKENLTYEVNQAKWAAARDFCKRKGWDFIVVTEKDLF